MRFNNTRKSGPGRKHKEPQTDAERRPDKRGTSLTAFARRYMNRYACSMLIKGKPHHR